MGGSVTVKSEVGVGTDFIISLKTQCVLSDSLLRLGLGEIEEEK